MKCMLIIIMLMGPKQIHDISIVIPFTIHIHTYIQQGKWAVFLPSAEEVNLEFYACPAGYCRCRRNTSFGNDTCVYSYINTDPDLQCISGRRGEFDVCLISRCTRILGSKNDDIILCQLKQVHVKSWSSSTAEKNSASNIIHVVFESILIFYHSPFFLQECCVESAGVREMV